MILCIYPIFSLIWGFLQSLSSFSPARSLPEPTMPPTAPSADFFSGLWKNCHSFLLWTELGSEKGFVQQQEGCNCSYSIRERYAWASWVNEILGFFMKFQQLPVSFKCHTVWAHCCESYRGNFAFNYMAQLTHSVLFPDLPLKCQESVTTRDQK